MLKVLKPGFYTTVQDLGRFNFQEFGVPISGVMDAYSGILANTLLRNKQNCAVLEITLSGPKLKFLEDTIISITGADITPKLNNFNISLNTALHINKGDVLSFHKLKYGCRCYLAVLGGFQSETVMQSRSMFKNITKDFRIQKDDVLLFEKKPFHSKNSNNAIVKINVSHFENRMMDVYKGPEFDMLTIEQQELLLDLDFTIAKENSRMAYQLVVTVNNSLKPIITSLVLPGTVQLTPSGKLIILMRDCQTTGGYPRVLQLSENAINRLSQKFTNDKIRFRKITQTI